MAKDGTLDTITREVQAIADGPIVLPGDDALLLAEFVRDDADLHLETPDGGVTIVRDYFSDGGGRDLMIAGAVVPGRVVGKLARAPRVEDDVEVAYADPTVATDAGSGAASFLDAAAPSIAPADAIVRAPETRPAEDAIAEVTEAAGDVFVTRPNGDKVRLEVGDLLFEDDLLATSADGSVGVTFVDGMTFSLSNGGRMVLDEFAFSAETQEGGGLFSVLQGKFSFVSGAAAHTHEDALMIDTPTMTIGVRGTKVVAEVAADGSTSRVALLSEEDGRVGKIMVRTDAGEELISDPNRMVEINDRSAPPSPQREISSGEVMDFFGSALDVLPAPTQLFEARPVGDGIKPFIEPGRRDADRERVRADEASEAAAAKQAQDAAEAAEAAPGDAATARVASETGEAGETDGGEEIVGDTEAAAETAEDDEATAEEAAEAAGQEEAGSEEAGSEDAEAAAADDATAEDGATAEAAEQADATEQTDAATEPATGEQTAAEQTAAEDVAADQGASNEQSGDPSSVSEANLSADAADARRSDVAAEPTEADVATDAPATGDGDQTNASSRTEISRDQDAPRAALDDRLADRSEPSTPPAFELASASTEAPRDAVASIFEARDARDALDERIAEETQDAVEQPPAFAQREEPAPTEERPEPTTEDRADAPEPVDATEPEPEAAPEPENASEPKPDVVVDAGDDTVRDAPSTPPRDARPAAEAQPAPPEGAAEAPAPEVSETRPVDRGAVDTPPANAPEAPILRPDAPRAPASTSPIPPAPDAPATASPEPAPTPAEDPKESAADAARDQVDAAAEAAENRVAQRTQEIADTVASTAAEEVETADRPAPAPVAVAPTDDAANAGDDARAAVDAAAAEAAERATEQAEETADDVAETATASAAAAQEEVTQEGSAAEPNETDGEPAQDAFGNEAPTGDETSEAAGATETPVDPIADPDPIVDPNPTTETAADPEPEETGGAGMEEASGETESEEVDETLEEPAVETGSDVEESVGDPPPPPPRPMATATVAEDAAPGEVFFFAALTEEESWGADVVYSLIDDAGGLFVVDPVTGDVSVSANGALDYETATNHQLIVRASDGVWSTDQTVAVAVADVDEAPIVDPTPPAETLAIASLAHGAEEFLVNTTKVNNQSAPAIATLDGGGYVIVWQSKDQDGDKLGVYGQRFNAEGAPVGQEFQVNTRTAQDQGEPAVVGLAGGGFVVIWKDDRGASTKHDIVGQLFDATGAPQGGEFTLNEETFHEQTQPSIAALTDGGFVAVWKSKNQDGSQHGVFQQRFDANGTPVGPEMEVNTHTHGEQTDPSVAALANGGWAVVWSGEGPNGSDDAHLRVYAPDGAPMGDQIKANAASTSTLQEYADIVGLTGGGFVVAWESEIQDGDAMGLFAQRFDANGGFVGDEIQVNTYFVGDQENVTLASLPDGGFVAAWESTGQDGDEEGVFAQRFDASGARVGGEERLSIETVGEQIDPALAALPDGRIVATWESEGDIAARTFEPNLAPTLKPAGAIVLDGVANVALGDPGENDAALDIGAGDFTVEAWFYYDGSSEQQTIVSKGASLGTEEGYRIAIIDGDLTVGASTGGFGLDSNTAASRIALAEPGWHHVALVVDQEPGSGAGAVKGYLNGSSEGWTPGAALVSDDTFTAGVIDNNDGFRIGADDSFGSAVNVFNEAIADVRVWRKARSESEIQMDMTRTLDGGEAGLISNWRLDEGFSGVVENAVDGRPDGAITPGAFFIDGLGVDADGGVANGRLAAEDLEGDALTFSVAAEAANGVAEIDASTGVWRYEADAGFVGVDTVSYQVSDGHGGVDSVSVSITVT